MRKFTLLFSLFFIIPIFTYSQDQHEGFENGIPAGWTVADNGVGTIESWGITTVAADVYSGQNAAQILKENLAVGEKSEDWLVTPKITIGKNSELRFWSRSQLPGDFGTKYEIRVSTPEATGPTDFAHFSKIAGFDEINLSADPTIYDEKVVFLGSWVGGSRWIAFVRVFERPATAPPAATGGDKWLLDDVSITEVGCPKPTSVSIPVVSITSSGLALAVAWTESGAEASGQVAVVPKGSGPNIPNAVVKSVAVSAVGSCFIEGLDPGICYSVYVRSFCGFGYSEWVGPVSTCDDNLHLTAFLDTNQNGVKDAGEVNFSNGQFVYNNSTSGTTLYGSPYGGDYFINDNNSVNAYNLSFTVSSDLANYYSCSTTYSDITVPAGSTTYYFPVTQTQTYNDLQVQLIPWNAPVPGFKYYNHIIYKNNTPQTVNSGTITFTKDNALSITSVSQTGTTTTASGFTYDFTNLGPYEQRVIYIEMQVPVLPTVSLGQSLTNTASITPLADDAIPSNNSTTLTRTIVASYDPNEKTESHGEKITITDFTPDDYLYYTVKFENTGTANAQFIRIEDMLDSKLDESTFEMLDASHAVNTKRTGSELSWFFDAINLPPTSSNPDESHGYVYYRIKPKSGFDVGTIIPGKADIYFDYNPPITTNTFNTEFVSQLGNSTFTLDNILLYPNPAHGQIQISLQNSAENLESIIIYDILGNCVKRINKLSSNQSSINVSALAKGVYLIEIATETQLKLTKKLVIE